MGDWKEQWNKLVTATALIDELTDKNELEKFENIKRRSELFLNLSEKETELVEFLLANGRSELRYVRESLYPSMDNYKDRPVINSRLRDTARSLINKGRVVEDGKCIRVAVQYEPLCTYQKYQNGHNKKRQASILAKDNGQ